MNLIVFLSHSEISPHDFNALPCGFPQGYIPLSSQESLTLTIPH